MDTPRSGGPLVSSTLMTGKKRRPSLQPQQKESRGRTPSPNAPSPTKRVDRTAAPSQGASPGRVQSPGARAVTSIPTANDCCPPGGRVMRIQARAYPEPIASMYYMGVAV